MSSTYSNYDKSKFVIDKIDIDLQYKYYYVLNIWKQTEEDDVFQIEINFYTGKQFCQLDISKLQPQNEYGKFTEDNPIFKNCCYIRKRQVEYCSVLETIYNQDGSTTTNTLRIDHYIYYQPQLATWEQFQSGQTFIALQGLRNVDQYTIEKYTKLIYEGSLFDKIKIPTTILDGNVVQTKEIVSPICYYNLMHKTEDKKYIIRIEQPQNVSFYFNANQNNYKYQISTIDFQCNDYFINVNCDNVIDITTIKDEHILFFEQQKNNLLFTPTNKFSFVLCSSQNKYVIVKNSSFKNFELQCKKQIDINQIIQNSIIYNYNYEHLIQQLMLQTNKKSTINIYNSQFYVVNVNLYHTILDCLFSNSQFYKNFSLYSDNILNSIHNEKYNLSILECNFEGVFNLNSNNIIYKNIQIKNVIFKEDVQFIFDNQELFLIDQNLVKFNNLNINDTENIFYIEYSSFEKNTNIENHSIVNKDYLLTQSNFTGNLTIILKDLEFIQNQNNVEVIQNIKNNILNIKEKLEFVKCNVYSDCNLQNIKQVIILQSQFISSNIYVSKSNILNFIDAQISDSNLICDKVYKCQIRNNKNIINDHVLSNFSITNLVYLLIKNYTLLNVTINNIYQLFVSCNFVEKLFINDVSLLNIFENSNYEQNSLCQISNLKQTYFNYDKNNIANLKISNSNLNFFTSYYNVFDSLIFYNNKNFMSFNAYGTSIKTLDIQKCGLKKIDLHEGFVKIDYLILKNNNLQQFTLGLHLKLISIDIHDSKKIPNKYNINQLRRFNISNNHDENFKYLYLIGNFQNLQYFDVKNNNNLQLISILNDNLSLEIPHELNIKTKVDLLDYLYDNNYIYHYNLENFNNLSNLNNLTYLDVSFTSIGFINAQNSKLIYFNCSNDNFIETVNVSNNCLAQCEIINCNQLNYVNIKNQFLYEQYYIDGKKYSEYIYYLKKVIISNNKNLKNINIQNNLKIQFIDLSNNSLQKVNLQEFINLKNINISYNNLQILKIDKINYIQTLDCSFNKIYCLVLPQKIVNLICKNNRINKLNLENKTDLQVVDVSYNLLNELIIENLKELKTLNAENNNLKNVNFYNLKNIKVNLKNNNLIVINSLFFNYLQFDKVIHFYTKNHSIVNDCINNVDSIVLDSDDNNNIYIENKNIKNIEIKNFKHDLTFVDSSIETIILINCTIDLLNIINLKLKTITLINTQINKFYSVQNYHYNIQYKNSTIKNINETNNLKYS